MLFAIDVGNTNTVLGLFDDQRLVQQWRIETKKERTADELGVLLKELFAHSKIDLKAIEGIIISNVVPPMQHALESMARRYLHQEPMNVGPKTKIKIKNRYHHPSEVGADRIVNAAAAYHKYPRALIVVDFGTATTFDYISPKGEYLGGAIAPGIMISNEALFTHASKLPRVEIAKPAKVIGRRTIESIQSGIFYGYVSMVDGLVEKIKKEVKTKPKVIATGGLAGLIAKDSKTIESVAPHLTLEGLRLIWDWNQ